VSRIGCSATPTGCGVTFESTQERSFSFTSNIAAAGDGRETSPFSRAARMPFRLNSEVLSRPRVPSSGMKASRKTIELTRGSTCSTTPDITQPP
jgi:hypothetical protein